MNTIQNWISEYDHWLPDEESLSKINELNANRPSTSKQNDSEIMNDEYLRKARNFKVYSLADFKTFTQRSNEISKWRTTGGVLLMGYESYRMLFADENPSRKKSKKLNLDGLTVDENRAALIDPGPDLVVCKHLFYHILMMN